MQKRALTRSEERDDAVSKSEAEARTNGSRAAQPGHQTEAGDDDEDVDGIPDITGSAAARAKQQPRARGRGGAAAVQQDTKLPEN